MSPSVEKRSCKKTMATTAAKPPLVATVGETIVSCPVESARKYASVPTRATSAGATAYGRSSIDGMGPLTSAIGSTITVPTTMSQRARAKGRSSRAPRIIRSSVRPHAKAVTTARATDTLSPPHHARHRRRGPSPR
jgi:hypothetical protein